MISEHDELIYLTELLLSSQNWTRSETDDVPVVLEIRDRISKLLSVPTDRIVGPGDPEGTQVYPWAPGTWAPGTNCTPAKEENCVKRWKSTRRRVTLPDGSIKWVPLDQLRKEMLGESKFKWVLKDAASPGGEL